MMLRILPFLMLPLLGIGQTNSKVEKPMGENTTIEKQALEIKRNVQYNLEEIKVRWRKAALENCTGVPCTVTPPAPSFICGTNTVTDVDGNIYNTVSIGTQCWTKTNLRVTKYNDGSAIPDQTSNTNAGWLSLATGARTDYVYTVVLGYDGIFGYLYNWYATTDSRKLCPTGWHVPTDGEWTSLIQFMVPSETVSAAATGTQSPNAGGKMKSKDTNSTLNIGLGWNPGSPPNPGTDNFDFSALPGGFRTNLPFPSIRNFAWFWSATSNGISGNAWYRDLNYNDSDVTRSDGNKSFGASIRCLKDWLFDCFKSRLAVYRPRISG
jgi:uncharacterized protein (TIGR02145 family)